MKESVQLTPTETERLLDFPRPCDISECWEWTGSLLLPRRTQDIEVGYNRSNKYSDLYQPHRLVASTVQCRHIRGLAVRQTCRNSICTNPEHLRIASPSRGRYVKKSISNILPEYGHQDSRFRLTIVDGALSLYREYKDSPDDFERLPGAIAMVFSINPTFIRMLFRGRLTSYKPYIERKFPDIVKEIYT